MACKRGALIVLEGVDRAGKTTQCTKLVESFREVGRAVHLLRFPGESYGAFGSDGGFAYELRWIRAESIQPLRPFPQSRYVG
jgi:adenylylsulfate kinase-like enzyme